MAKGSNNRKVKALILLLSALLIYATHPAFARDENEGEAWLHMSPDSRAGFAWGYTIGLSRRFAQGCNAYRSINPSKSRDLHDDPFAKCLGRGEGFSRSVDYYVKKVTEFYESYPLDHDVLFEEVLKRLSDSENMTPAQIHQWAEQRQHVK